MVFGALKRKWLDRQALSLPLAVSSGLSVEAWGR